MRIQLQKKDDDVQREHETSGDRVGQESEVSHRRHHNVGVVRVVRVLKVLGVLGVLT